MICQSCMCMSGGFSQSQSHIVNYKSVVNILLVVNTGVNPDPPSKIILGKPKEWCSGIKMSCRC